MAPSLDTTLPGAAYAPPAAAALAPCRNCDAERVGEYCHACGQHFLEDRLTMRLLAAEAWERVTFERGFLRTLADMTVRPGVVVRRYVEGQRRRYLSPVTYLLVGAAVSVLAYQLYREQAERWMRESFREATTSAGHAVFTHAQNEVYVRLSTGMAQQTTTTGLVLCVVFALFVRLLFRRSGINLAESLVFALFTFGHVFLVSAPVAVVLANLLDRFDLSIYAVFPLYLLVSGLAAAQYFGRPVRSVLKAAVALLASYLVFTMLAGVALFTWVRLTVS